MVQMTGEFPRAIARPVWLTARARNAAPSDFHRRGRGERVHRRAGRARSRTATSATSRADAEGCAARHAAFTAALVQARTRMGRRSVVGLFESASARRKVGIDTLSRALIARRYVVHCAWRARRPSESSRGRAVAASYRASRGVAAAGGEATSKLCLIRWPTSSAIAKRLGHQAAPTQCTSRFRHGRRRSGGRFKTLRTSDAMKCASRSQNSLRRHPASWSSSRLSPTPWRGLPNGTPRARWSSRRRPH